jgi:hypothetical protein
VSRCHPPRTATWVSSGEAASPKLLLHPTPPPSWMNRRCSGSLRLPQTSLKHCLQVRGLPVHTFHFCLISFPSFFIPFYICLCWLHQNTKILHGLEYYCMFSAAHDRIDACSVTLFQCSEEKQKSKENRGRCIHGT